MKSRLLSMLLMGFALAVGFLVAVQISHSLRKDVSPGSDAPPVTQEELNQTVLPILFKAISERNGKLSLRGTSEPNAVISIQNFGENYRQIKAGADGNWEAVLDVQPSDTLELGLFVYINKSVEVRSEEIVYRIPPPRGDDDEALVPYPALIMVTAPGGPTRIIQSPFRGVPASGPLSMGPVDYDERGSVIFSGTSEAAGRVRIYANDVMVGQSSVAANGRWFSIAGEKLPVGEYGIKAELSLAGDVKSSVNVTFSRSKQAGSQKEPQRISVEYGPDRWQIGRQLYGGGSQYTAIFAPENVQSETARN